MALTGCVLPPRPASPSGDRLTRCYDGPERPSTEVAVVEFDSQVYLVSTSGVSVLGRAVFLPGRQRLDMEFNDGRFRSLHPITVETNLAARHRYRCFYTQPATTLNTWNPAILDVTDDAAVMRILTPLSPENYRLMAVDMLASPALLERVADDPSAQVRAAVASRLTARPLLQRMARDDLSRAVRQAAQERLADLSQEATAGNAAGSAPAQ